MGDCGCFCVPLKYILNSILKMLKQALHFSLVFAISELMLEDILLSM
jgi:hypothetical protein